MRGADSEFRWAAVFLLLALRAGQRSIDQAGRLRRPRRLGGGEGGPPASDCRVSPEGGTGVRPAMGADRGVRRGAGLGSLPVKGRGEAPGVSILVQQGFRAGSASGGS